MCDRSIKELRCIGNRDRILILFLKSYFIHCLWANPRFPGDTMMIFLSHYWNSFGDEPKKYRVSIRNSGDFRVPAPPPLISVLNITNINIPPIALRRGHHTLSFILSHWRTNTKMCYPAVKCMVLPVLISRLVKNAARRIGRAVVIISRKSWKMWVNPRRRQCSW